MDLKRICVVYFSPTGGTEHVARLVAGELAAALGLEQEFIPFTLPQQRQERRFGPSELVVMASPVYAGRLPNKLMPEYREKLWGEDTPAIPLCVFGNRSPDEAVRELALLLEGNGFHLAAAAAFAGRHAFSDRVGFGRPDGDDLAQIRNFAAQAAKKLAGETLPPLELDRGEIGPYYTPLRADGVPAKFLKARPVTSAGLCVRCGACARSCPMDSIDRESMEAVGVCIKCQACVRRCPTGAKHFEDPDFLSHVEMLEQNYTRRAENVLLL